MIASTASSLLLALAAVSSVQAFTNGTLIPGYLCGPLSDGLPKSIGGVIKTAAVDLSVIAFNNNTADNLNVTANRMTGKIPGNSAFVLSSIHNQLNSITAQQQMMLLTTAAPLMAGTPLTLKFTTASGANIDGMFIFAEDIHGQKIGTFSDAGGMFAPFLGCGVDPQGNPSGLVHTQVISQSSSYNSLSFTPPSTLAAGQTVTLRGLSVTDAGFGFHCNQLTQGSNVITPCKIVEGVLVGPGVQVQTLLASSPTSPVTCVAPSATYGAAPAATYGAPAVPAASTMAGPTYSTAAAQISAQVPAASTTYLPAYMTQTSVPAAATNAIYSASLKSGVSAAVSLITILALASL